MRASDRPPFKAVTTEHKLIQQQRWAMLSIFIATFALISAAYLPTLSFPYVSDDGGFIEHNIKLQTLPTAELWRLFVEPFNEALEFLPLRELSFWVDVRLFGLDPSASRVHNLLLHLAVLPLLFLVTAELWRTFLTGRQDDAPLAAAVVVALFALHPALVESVAWISGRKYLLANLFSALALWLALRARSASGLSHRTALLTLVAFCCVMLSKSSYVALAPVIAILWIVHARTLASRSAHYRVAAWSFVLGAAAAGLLAAFMAVVVSGSHDSVVHARPIGPAGSLAALGWLLRLALAFEPRHFFYPVVDGADYWIMIAVGGGMVALTALATWHLVHQRSIHGPLILMFALLCLPYLSILPFVSPSVVQDRYVSLAIWPLIMGAVAATWSLRGRYRYFILAVLALTWGHQTLTRAPDWRSLDTLIDSDLRAFPGYFMPIQYRITTTLLPQARFSEAADLAKGIELPEARRMTEALIRATYRLDLARHDGNPEPAMAALWHEGEAITKFPDDAASHGPLILARLKSRAYLVDNWKQLADRFGDSGIVRYNTGLWFLKQGLADEAEIQFRAALDLEDLPAEYRGMTFRNLGLALLYLDKLEASERVLRSGLNQPNPDLRAHCALARVYEKMNRPEDQQAAKSVCMQVGN